MKQRSVFLCRAPTSAQQRLLSSGGSLWISTQTSPEHPWDPAEPGLCFLRDTSWGSWHQTVVPMAGLAICFTKIAIGALIQARCRKYQQASVGIFCTRKATIPLTVTKTRPVIFSITRLGFSTLSEQWMSPCCHPLWKGCLIPSSRTSRRNIWAPHGTWLLPPSLPTVLFPRRDRERAILDLEEGNLNWMWSCY